MVLGLMLKNVKTERSHKPGYPKIISKNVFLLPVVVPIMRKFRIMCGRITNVNSNIIYLENMINKKRNFVEKN